MDLQVILRSVPHHVRPCHYKTTNWNGNQQVKAIPLMAAGGRSHLLSSVLVPNWDGETHGNYLFYMRRHGTTDCGHFGINVCCSIMLLKRSNFEGTQAWPVPFGDPEGVGQRIFDYRMHLKAPLARNPLLDTLGSLREDRRTLPDGKANKREEMMLFHGALSNK
jgi:hypothetical protein